MPLPRPRQKSSFNRQKDSPLKKELIGLLNFLAVKAGFLPWARAIRVSPFVRSLFPYARFVVQGSFFEGCQ